MRRTAKMAKKKTKKTKTLKKAKALEHTRTLACAQGKHLT